MVRMLRNPHFWINVAITAFICYVYYDWYDRFEWFWWYSTYEGIKSHATGSLFAVPFLYAAVKFRFRGALIFWIISFSIVLPRVIFFSYDSNGLASNIILAFAPLLIVGIITLELNWRNRQHRLVEQRQEERHIYLTQIFRAQEKERQRIALELHDSCVQELIGIANRANDLTFYDDFNNIVKVHENAAWIRDTIMQVSEELRRMSLDLRPGLLDNLGLVPAVRWLAERMNRENQINTEVSVKGKHRKLPSETEATIFRVIQEALSNIRRHSEATSARVFFEFKPGSISVTIEDNGKGFEKCKTINTLVTNNQLGILSMEQRVKSIDGVFSVQSRPGKGTSITIGADIF